MENIIRVGSAGAINEKAKLRSIVLGMGACTNSGYASQYGLCGTIATVASWELLRAATAQADRMGLDYEVGTVLSSDTFYNDSMNTMDWQKMGVLAIEMEAAALYLNAARAGKNALCICTISDSLVTGEALDAEQRQNTFTEMMELALEIA